MSSPNELRTTRMKGKLPLASMNYRALAICPHELPSVIPDPSNNLILANSPCSLVSSRKWVLAIFMVFSGVFEFDFGEVGVDESVI